MKEAVEPTLTSSLSEDRLVDGTAEWVLGEASAWGAIVVPVLDDVSWDKLKDLESRNHISRLQRQVTRVVRTSPAAKTSSR